jgi:FtsP/CotA-like multicopper oxidase with cupredoxin domain
MAYEQVSNGLSGLIVIDGLMDLLPKSLQNITQQTIAMKDFEVSSDPAIPRQRTVNGQVNPEINIKPGETQLWRLANIGSETYYNIVLPNHTFHVIAEDGNPVWHVWDAKQLLLPSGKRYDVLVTAGAAGTYPLIALSTHLGCMYCPEVTLAEINAAGVPKTPASSPSNLTSRNDLGNQTVDRYRTLVFSSNDKERHYMIDGNIFDPARIDQQVKLGDLEEWTIRNMDDEEQSHTFHIHVNDFQVMSINGQPYNASGLQDTVVLPGKGEVVIRIPFDDFIGKFVYHCHIIFHEDHGMMGVVEVTE